MSSESMRETVKHQTDLEKLLGLDTGAEGVAMKEYKTLVHLNHRFFKTFFPEDEDSFCDHPPFNHYTNFECWELLGKSLVEL